MTPNSIVIPGSFECYGWWETFPYLERPGGGQTWAEDYGTIDTMATWASNNLQGWPTGGQADPDGGTNAYIIQETNDGGPTIHSANSNCGNLACSWNDFLIWGKPINRDWSLIYMNVVNTGLYVNWNTGATQAFMGSVTAVDLGAASSGRWFLVQFRPSASGAGNVRIYPADNTPNYNYTGTGLICHHVYIRAAPIALRHTHLTTLYDMSLNVGIPRGNDLTQPALAQRQLIQDTFSSVNGYADPLTESGRVSRLINLSLGNVVSGTDQAWACIGVGGLGAGSSQLSRFYDTSGTADYVIPVNDNGANIVTVRKGAIAADTQSICASGLMVAPCSFAYIFNNNRTGALYINGAQAGTFTHNAAGLVTMSPGQYYNIFVAIPGYGEIPASALYRGQVPGATFDDQYRWLRRALAPMAHRWGRPA